MRKPMAKKVLAASMAAAMTMSAAACGDTASTTETSTQASTEASVVESVTEPEEEVSPYTVIKDADGNTVDLGGMEVIIRDWWSGDGSASEPSNDYEEARQEYRDWIQETYNFKIKTMGISDWGSTPQDFIDYVTSGGDENNYVFTLDSRSAAAMSQGFMYDLSTLDCLDFTEAKFTSNKMHELYSKGSSIYAMSTGKSEPRTGIWFNKRLLTEAGIDYQTIYDMYDAGTWTWDAFESLCEQVQRDIDNDGVIDVWAMSLNEGNMTKAAVWSNNACFVKVDADGKYVYCVEDANTLEALNWANDMFAKYDEPSPEGAEWNYYKQQVCNGECVFFPEDAYVGNSGGVLTGSEDEFGYVAFPIGPQGTTYVNCWANNIFTIPSCYDAEKAWKIAFAYNLYTNEPAGYEDYVDNTQQLAGKYDEQSLNVWKDLQKAEHGIVAYDGLVANLNLNDGFIYSIGGSAVISELIDAKRDEWKTYIDEANK